ncbi:MAG: DHH family phosphoesterase [Acidobacteria bacterium]|nr:DHH family phosphoesterase [Acidobacteriota bacterium]
MTDPMQEKLDELLALPLDEGPLLILTHDNPDPDSIASAVAMSVLLREARGIESKVAYSGIIGRAENRALAAELDLDIAPLGDYDLSKFGHFAIVDAQPGTGNNAVTAEHTIDIVVDHHFLREATAQARFADVREHIGASASILTHYMRLAGVEIDSDLATALLYGIRSETQDLGREVSPEDRSAYEFLMPKFDPEKMARIARPALERRYYQQLAKALNSLMIGPEEVICPMGEVTDPDFVPEMADLMVRMEGMTWSFAYGTFENRMYVSIRANDHDANAGDVMMSVLSGIGKGGGHGMRAGGNVELSELKLTRGELEAELKHRFLAAIDAQSVVLRPLRSSETRKVDEEE